MMYKIYGVSGESLKFVDGFTKLLFALNFVNLATEFLKEMC